MKNFRLGFTLSEVLLTLGVTAILAAVTMPQLVKSFQKNQAGPLVARVVQQIETGNQNIIQAANANGVFTDSLDNITYADLGINQLATPIFGLGLFSVIPHFWNLNPNNINTRPVLKKFDGTTVKNSDTIVSVFSWATLFNFSKIPASVALAGDKLLMPSKYYIFIDTNTWDKAPNTFGKDIFVFELTEKGKLIPYGEGSTGAEYTKRLVKDGYRIKYY